MCISRPSVSRRSFRPLEGVDARALLVFRSIDRLPTDRPGPSICVSRPVFFLRERTREGERSVLFPRSSFLLLLLPRPYEDPTTRAWIVWALIKLCVFYRRCSSSSFSSIFSSPLEEGRHKDQEDSSSFILSTQNPSKNLSDSENNRGRGLPSYLLRAFQKQQSELVTPTEVQERSFRGLLLLQFLPLPYLR